MSLLPTVRGFLRRLTHRGPTVASVMPAFLASREALGLRKASLVNYGCFGKRAIKAYGGWPLASINDATLREIIARHCSDEADYYLIMLRWAIRVDLLPRTHPLPRKPQTPKVDHKRPCYMLAGDVRRHLHAIREMDAEMLPAFLLGYYAGQRPMEVCRLSWEDIKVSDRQIRIEARVSKIRRHRLIQHVPPILWELLTPLLKTRGLIIPEVSEERANYRWIRIRKAAAAAAGIKLGHDIVRHTFATHLVALTGNPSFVAHILGHHDLSMLDAHYNGVATRAEGEAYFELDGAAAAQYVSSIPREFLTHQLSTPLLT